METSLPTGQKKGRALCEQLVCLSIDRLARHCRASTSRPDAKSDT